MVSWVIGSVLIRWRKPIFEGSEAMHQSGVIQQPREVFEHKTQRLTLGQTGIRGKSPKLSVPGIRHFCGKVAGQSGRWWHLKSWSVSVWQMQALPHTLGLEMGGV